jgi:MipA family protein
MLSPLPTCRKVSMNTSTSSGFAQSLLSLLLVIAFTAQAAENEGTDEHDGSRWGLGLGISSKKKPYAGVGTDTRVIPLVSFENRYVRLFGNQFDVKLASQGAIDFSLRTQVSIGGGYKGSDSSQLNGMADRKGTIFVGAASTWHNDIADISAAWLQDASGHSEGSEFKLGAQHSFRLPGRFEVTPHLEYVHFDSRYVDYYYGVRANEATTTRRAYTGKGTSEVQAGVRFGYMLTRHQRFLLDVSEARLGSGITDSPIVNRKSLPELRFGYLYAF